MRRNRNAKIVATLGPASSSLELIRALFDAGADVFRLNFSHGTHDDHKRRFDAIRAIERDVGRPIGILQDLQGPKIRIGTLKSGPTRLTPEQHGSLSPLVRAGGRARRCVTASGGRAQHIAWPFIDD
jgi:pyruvate kinase